MFEPFLDGLRALETPNPDVACNRVLKFGALKRHCAERLGAATLATGHYARVDHDTGAAGPTLRRGFDGTKDQSYFLSGVGPGALDGVEFPLGYALKRDLAAVAAASALPRKVVERRESVGLCFVGKRNFADFISDYVTPTPGRFVSVDDGADLGPHGGAELYTVGQRARLGGFSTPWFVAGKNLGGEVLVAPGADHPALFSATVFADSDAFAWVGGAPHPDVFRPHGLECLSQTRYRQAPLACRVTAVPGGRLRAVLDTPQRGVAPGQVMALYSGDTCLGGGAISGADGVVT